MRMWCRSARKNDTAVVDENDRMTEEAEKAAKVLEKICTDISGEKSESVSVQLCAAHGRGNAAFAHGLYSGGARI